MAKIKFSEIHIGAFVWYNGCYACKINATELFYREKGEDEIKKFSENEDIEIEEDNGLAQETNTNN